MNTVYIKFLNGDEVTFEWDEMDETNDRILYQKLNGLGKITDILNVRKEHILYTKYKYISYVSRKERI